MTDQSSIISLKSKLNKEKWEFKSLGEIATEIIEGKEVTKVQVGSGNYPAIRYAEIFKHQICIEECTSEINPEIIKSPKCCQYGDLLFSKFSENIQETGKSIVYLGNSKPIIGQHIIAIRHNENPKFLQYLMSCEFVKKQIQSLAISSTVFCLYSKHIKKIKIPLPPRDIQDQIAEYLDKWTNLENQLEQELEQRKKQYEYYKESLLNSGMNKWDIISLDKISTEIIAGVNVTKDHLGTGDYPVIRYSDIFHNPVYLKKCEGFIDKGLIKSPKFCEYGDILVAVTSNVKENIGKTTVYLGNEKPIFGSHIFLLRHNQNPKFLSLLINCKFVKSQIKSLSKQGTVIELRKSCFQHIKVALPSLEEQTQIVEILDKFHTITESFKDGLPSLIEKHRKQYTYYKEQILNPEITL